MLDATHGYNTPNNELTSVLSWGMTPGDAHQADQGTEIFTTPSLEEIAGSQIKVTLSGSAVTAQQRATANLHSNDAVSLLAQSRSSLRIGEAKEYTPLPLRKHFTEVPANVPCWRIELHGLSPHGPLGLDLFGDIIFGRGSDADIDLDAYKGFENAVSRRHALLRPSRRQLHLIDLGSTNGTFHNSIPLARCITYSIQSNDIITLGLQSFTIKIIDGPAGVAAAA